MRQETARPSARSIRPALATPAGAALFAIVAVFLAAAAVRSVLAAHADRSELATGKAEWIWSSDRGSERQPQRIFATRDLFLPSAPQHATAKLFVDREHVLFVNGVEAGRGTQAPGDSLRIYRIAPLLAPGENRLTIEASSPTGAGGILFSLDIDGFGRDAIVSDGLWRVDSSPRALTAGGRYRPRIWGKPPQRPWGYPRLPRPGELRSADSAPARGRD